MMFEDPVVKEIRDLRQKHAAKFDYDIQRIFADLKQTENKLDQPAVSLPPKKPRVSVK